MAATSMMQGQGTEPHGAAPQPRIEEPFTLVIFGATGALCSGKLMPALFKLWQSGFLTVPFAIVGVGRQDQDNARFRDELREAAKTHGLSGVATGNAWERFAENIFYHRADFTVSESYPRLSARLQELERQLKLRGNRLFYLATDPDFFSVIVEQLAAAGLVRRAPGRPWTRLVVEKPFGKDLTSSQALDGNILLYAREEQVYRIDHYLGKETVQNILAFRFGNAVFEPMFNRRYVDHVQITMAETVGMEGRRGAYYNHAGALRDVAQNHLLQLLALVAMEPPASLGATDVRDEKVKVLRSLVRPERRTADEWVVRGQYGPGLVNGQSVRGFREEEAVAGNSSTETYIGMRIEVDTWRWAGVPFFLRTGKRLARRVTEIAVEFKRPPRRLFTAAPGAGDLCDRVCRCGPVCSCCRAGNQPGVLVFRLQPDEGISLAFAAKRPGMQLVLQPVHMEFLYDKSFPQSLPEAYERLLLDALRGDATLFTRSDEVAAAWEFITPILDEWRRQPPPEFPTYAAGSWGPTEADRLLDGCQQRWRQP